MKIKSENYLERVPMKSPSLRFSEEGERVTLEVDNKGLFNRIAQNLFRKPPVSYIHLDELGSFIWNSIDGERDLVALGELLKERFGEEAEPLYERLSKYIAILASYGFISFKN